MYLYIYIYILNVCVYIYIHTQSIYIYIYIYINSQATAPYLFQRGIEYGKLASRVWSPGVSGRDLRIQAQLLLVRKIVPQKRKPIVVLHRCARRDPRVLSSRDAPAPDTLERREDNKHTNNVILTIMTQMMIIIMTIIILKILGDRRVRLAHGIIICSHYIIMAV